MRGFKSHDAAARFCREYGELRNLLRRSRRGLAHLMWRRRREEEPRQTGHMELMKQIADWSPSSDIRVLAVDGEDGRWLVSGEASAACACPDCQQPSRVRHGRYSRDLQDLPAQGQPVVIRVSVQRWRCRNALFRRQTFGSRMPEAAGFAARRTRRVTDVAGCLGHAVGGRPAQRLTARLGLTTSRVPSCARLKRAQGSAPGALRVVGIDGVDGFSRPASRYQGVVIIAAR
jgi:hypothetical protein